MGILRSVGRHIVNRIAAAPREIEQTAIAKIQQGASEVSNALFSGTSNAYSPYTADNAAYRAQFQAKSQSQALEQ